MVGGGGKIGGGGRSPISAEQPPVAREQPAAKSSAPGKPVTARPADSFEKASRQASAKPPGSMAAEQSSSKDVLKLARDNPAAAKQLLATIAAQAQKNNAKVQQELAGARGALEQLGAQRFSKKELEKKQKSLKQKRERISSLKMRISLGERKMALLQQLAGKLDDPELEEELERILGNHEKLETDWGKRHHLFSVAESFFGADEETPDHLRQVVKADIRPGPLAEEIGSTISEVSPRRVIAELIARTLDGSIPEAGTTGEGTAKPTPGVRGEHGQALQSWTTLGETMAAALARDPFAKTQGGT